MSSVPGCIGTSKATDIVSRELSSICLIIASQAAREIQSKLKKAKKIRKSEIAACSWFQGHSTGGRLPTKVFSKESTVVEMCNAHSHSIKEHDSGLQTQPTTTTETETEENYTNQGEEYNHPTICSTNVRWLKQIPMSFQQF